MYKSMIQFIIIGAFYDLHYNCVAIHNHLIFGVILNLNQTLFYIIYDK